MELQERINKKEQQITKLEKRLEVLLKECSKEEYEAIIFFIETGDRSLYRNYLKSHNLFYGSDAYSKASELYDARNTLAKYEKQLIVEEDKNKTLNELPEVLIQFKNKLIENWNKYDEWKREQIKKEYREAEKLPLSDYRKITHELNDKWGKGWYDFMNLSNDEIHRNNEKAAETLILNLINRTVELTGKIIDCKYLHLDSDNNGYAIINGIIIGERGSAEIESIGAGGHNIQRYHIRVLVKEVK